MRMRHDTPIRLTIHSPFCEWGVYTHDCTAETMDAALTVEAIKHGKVSGMDSGLRVTYDLEILDRSYLLTGDQLCTCARCEPA